MLRRPRQLSVDSILDSARSVKPCAKYYRPISLQSSDFTPAQTAASHYFGHRPGHRVCRLGLLLLRACERTA